MQSYIERYADEAIYQMLEYKVPASVTLAQAIFESRSGGSDLARKSNNHFGIKCHLEWGGDTVAKHDDTLNECFRKYRLVADSYTDHSMFLRSRARYASLFELPLDDYKSWCYGLKAAGYATYPSYAEDLITIIEQFRLYELDGYQNLDAVNVFNLREPEMIPGPARPDCSLQELARTGLLWTDEKDLLVQSLELLIETPQESDEEFTSLPDPVAGNKSEAPAPQQQGCDLAARAGPKKDSDVVKPLQAQRAGEMADWVLLKENTRIIMPEEMKAAHLTEAFEPWAVPETRTLDRNTGPAVPAPPEEDPAVPGVTKPAEYDLLTDPVLSGYDYVKP